MGFNGRYCLRIFTVVVHIMMVHVFLKEAATSFAMGTKEVFDPIRSSDGLEE